MAGCRSCSGCSSEPSLKSVSKVEKLDKISDSDNPRYPRIFVGKQAMYTDENSQVIVTVLDDCCDEKKDHFRLKPLTILKGTREIRCGDGSFDVTQPAGGHLWNLQALI